MRKFAFLLALAAMLAFAGAAFAGAYVDIGQIQTATDPSTGNTGAVTGTADRSTKLYYFGDVGSSKRFTVAFDTVLSDNSTASAPSNGKIGVKYGSKVLGSDATYAGNATPLPHALTFTGLTDLSDIATLTVGVYDMPGTLVDSDTPISGAVTKDLTVVPVKIELEIPGPIRIAEGTETTEVQIELKNEGLTPHFFGDGFKADSPSDVSPTITPGLDGLVINAGNADPGTYVFEVKTQPGTSMTVDETGGATGIAVANFNTGDEVKVCEMTVIIVGYEVTPSSADWNSASPDVVKFTVDMKYDDFKGIGLKKPNDTDGTDIGDIATEFYTVTQTADGIEIEIKLEYLVEHLTVSGDYVFNVADEDNRQAYFTLRVTIDPENDVPAKGVQPLGEDAQKGPPGIDYGIAQIRLSADSVKSLLPKDMLDVVSEDGRIKQDEAVKLTGADPDTLTVLHSVATTLTGEATIAPITFNVKGSELVSEEVDGIRWYDAIIHKMFVRDDGPASVRLAPARTFDAIKNGTFMIMVESNDEVGDPVARLLSADYVIERDDKQYKLVVFIEDDKDYDLDKKTPGHIVDPIAIQESSGGSGSSSGCEMGAGLAAIAGLAAAAIKRRKR